jgi:pilus assembly protein Flp/PilA
MMGLLNARFARNSVLARLVRDDSGATAIEYGLIAALIAVAAIVAMQAVGTSLISIFTTIAKDL